MAFNSYGGGLKEVVQPVIKPVGLPKEHKVVQLPKKKSSTTKDAQWWKDYRKRLKEQRTKPGHCKHCGKKI